MGRKITNIKSYKKKADEYFALCDSENSAIDKKLPLAKPYTLSGLLCALELTRDGFYSLKNTREGRIFVDFTLMKIEAYIEENALSGRISASAAASSLKYCFGWNDKEHFERNENVSVFLSNEAKELGE